MSDNDRKCPDCEVGLQRIKLLDATELRPVVRTPHSHGEVHYAAADAEPSFWEHTIPSKGKVNAFVCTECARILLYGERA